eukprot:TRINITY_DN9467_c0_g1_i5.p1 TRINITY_DN9467_c0_g1~~TRINITY_DN9467_c0_g1_i5.p1  ORF type:complete len:183 (+),score=53.30 TRINITY_DN9467_c0_g1_i5:149-697(+)
MLRSLVGSEMCIRDSISGVPGADGGGGGGSSPTTDDKKADALSIVRRTLYPSFPLSTAHCTAIAELCDVHGGYCGASLTLPPMHSIPNPQLLATQPLSYLGSLVSSSNQTTNAPPTNQAAAAALSLEENPLLGPAGALLTAITAQAHAVVPPFHGPHQHSSVQRDIHSWMWRVVSFIRRTQQ